MNPNIAIEIERRKHLEMMDAFPMIAILQGALAALVLCVTVLNYGLSNQTIIWAGLFVCVISARYIVDRSLRPRIDSHSMHKTHWLTLLTTRSLIGFVWSLGSIWYIQLAPEHNLLSTTIWCTALAFAGTIFHINSISALQVYFWSLILPLVVYFSLGLERLFEAFILVLCGVIYVSLYTRILHNKAIKRIAEEIEKEQLIRQLSEANHSIKALAEQDALTELKNRTYFNQKIEAVWQRSKEKHQVLCVILFDIDHFKPFNDNYGHVSGDKALRKVAKRLKTIDLEAEYSFFARVGGEEFVAVLPNTRLDKAISIAELIRLDIENAAIAHQYSSCADVITISAGVAMSTSEAASSIIEMMEQADKALYLAKEGGRNQVAIAEDLAPKEQPHRVELQAQPS
ncbi:GGDEF domain-containing protein [Vibrio europaeus]|uniref:GGDEF domain-containing protein n=1 Tax=Vibrio europaeus TaxID=300876 RepID=UPI00148C93A3|nr:GGDEF domain-containing protein [Vibrio europaeus]MDC5722778.1 GGDEF domain-containing protein [Vibrio europaeus]MDC5758486.1 GGDEF domain-containing protein [Vibrio europaeus]MDC5777533.1 GGDEF domain-containing protein [Vibrio europaeus]MDC5796601.1 GGDEF domain-containing protein [Vibrio europaeus]MDC5801329.1 GGDEF domain-containing protein [Vibrio europaeus]